MAPSSSPSSSAPAAAAAGGGPAAQTYALPIAARPRRTWAQTAHGLAFALFFLVACVMIDGAQFAVLLPLKLVPHRRARKLYYEGVRYTKGAFGALLGECFPLSLGVERGAEYGGCVV